MKNKTRKSIAVILVLALLATLSGVLFACTRDKGDNNTADRANALNSIKASALKAMDATWTPGLSDRELSELSDCGDYIVALSWTDFFCDLLNSSGLQTGKLKTTADILASQEGQDLMEDFTSNAGDIIPLFKRVGFTSVDVSSLIDAGLKKLVNDGLSTVSACTARLNSVKAMVYTAPSVLENLNKNLANMDEARINLSFSAEDKSEMLSVFDGAKSSMSAMVAFGYNIGVTAVTDNIFDNIFGQSGALENITNSEIKTYINTLSKSAQDLKTALGGDELEKLNAALETIIGRFDNASRSSAIISEIVKYSKYAFLAADFLPAVCDVITAAVGSADDAMLTSLRDYMGNQFEKDGDVTLNRGILFAKAASAVANGKTQSEVEALVDSLSDKVGSDPQKAMALFYVDYALNILSATGGAMPRFPARWDALSDALNQDKPEGAEKENAFANVILMAFAEANLEKFKQTYYDYLNGRADLETLASVAQRSNFTTYLGESASYNYRTQTAQWFAFYFDGVTAKLKTDIKFYKATVVEDVKEFISDFYTNGGIEELDELAAFPLFAAEGDGTDENYARAFELYHKFGFNLFLSPGDH